LSKQEYWKKRAGKYSSFQWANDPKYIDLFLNFLEFRKEDLVLDAGIGTGLISDKLSGRVRAIVGVDSSLSMLQHCSKNGNTILAHEDLRNLSFMNESFDKVIARNVLHHIYLDVEMALAECYRVLKEGGEILVGDRVAPAEEVKEEYKKILALKDRRVIFTPLSLCKLLVCAGFRIEKFEDFWTRDLSVKSWLQKSGLSQEIQDEILFYHAEGSEEFKRAQNVRMVGEKDCLIDIKNVVIKGVK